MEKRYCENCEKEHEHFIDEECTDEGFFEECWRCSECGDVEFI